MAKQVYVRIYRLWSYIHEKVQAPHTDGLTQDCSISIANALELLQSCAKP